MNDHRNYIQRLVNVINNLPCTGANVHERANVLCTLINCYKVSTFDDTVSKAIIKAEGFLKKFFYEQSNRGA